MKPTNGNRPAQLAAMRTSEKHLTAQIRAAKTVDERAKLTGYLEDLQHNIGAVEREGLAAKRRVASKSKAKRTPPTSSTPPTAAAPIPPTRTTTITALRRTDRALVELLGQRGLSSKERSNAVAALTEVRASLVAKGEPLPSPATAPRDNRLARMDRVVARALGVDKPCTMNVGGHQLVGVPDGWDPFPTVA